MKKFIFSFTIFFSILSYSEEKKSFYNEHVKPSLVDGFDYVGWSVLLGGAALAAIVKPQDEVNSQWVKDNVKLSREVLKHGDYFGSDLPGLVIAAVQYKHSPPHGRAHFKALIFNSLSVTALKRAIDRERPNGKRYSMPSGHTSSAFASATHLAYAYGWKWAIPSYTIATLVAVERVYDEMHWVSDVVAGAALGFFWGRATHKHELNVLPVVDSEKVGFVWQKRF